MSDRVQSMLAELEDDSVAFKNFMEKFEENSNRIFLFLEGEDDINYYNISFTTHLGEFQNDWDYIVSYGRKNVEAIIKNLENHSKQEYKSSKYFGFIDKDYHESSPSSNRIYMTPYYSIENFYTNENFIRHILIHKFKLSDKAKPESTSDFRVCFNQFMMLLEQFINSIKLLDILIRTNRLMYKEKVTDLKINARDLNLDNFIYISLDEVRLYDNQSAFEFIGVDQSKFDSSLLDNAREFYKDKSFTELTYFIRGKFMLHFIHNFIFRLKEASQSKELKKIYYKNSLIECKNKKKKFKSVNISVFKENHDIISDFSQYAVRPKCLNLFLNNIITTYKKIA